MATNPTTAPTAAPTTDLFFPLAPSVSIQVIIAVADAKFVFKKAFTASSLAASADPALNPNQPNQSNPVPSKI